MERLRCVIVDDDAQSMSMLSDFCQDVPYVDVAGRFLDSSKFMNSMDNIDFDLCLLDLNMSGMNGLKIARRLDGKSVIFVAGGNNLILSAINMAPVDIVLKPLKKERVNIALKKAYAQVLSERPAANNSGYITFTCGDRGMVKVRLSDILYVYADKKDARNKYIVTKDGISCLAMKYRFEKLCTLSPNLIRVNRAEMIAIEEVRALEHDTITLNLPIRNDGTKQVVLSRTYSNEFRKLLSAY